MSVLIKDTTREEREKLIKDSVALATLGSKPLTKKAMDLFNKYIDGEMEMKDVEAAVIALYSQNTDVSDNTEADISSAKK